MVIGEYTIRAHQGGYEITKWWPGHDFYYSNGSWCTCPSSGPCKHMELVQLFQELGEPQMRIFLHDGENWK